MSDEMMTAEKFMQMVNAMKNSLDTAGLEEQLWLEIALDFNMEHKLKMIKSVQGLYRYLHGNGPKPEVMPSDAFNPFQGVERTNLHYFFKAMKNMPPWDLPKEQFVAPVALTLLLIEVAYKLFPDPIVYRYKLLIDEFINRWTLPKLRPQWDDEELKRQIEQYQSDMQRFEERIKESYISLSSYFKGLETPEQDPVRNAISETQKHAREIAKKLCIKEPNASFVAQEKALQIWNEYRTSPEVKTKYCTKNHRIGYADIFDYCKRGLTDLGFKTASAFEKSVKAAQRRAREAGKVTSENA